MSAVEYWAHRFGVCKAALLKAIDEVGPAVAEVRRHLGR
jgi:hypothetical protein